MLTRLNKCFSEHQKATKLTAELLPAKIIAVAEAMLACFKNGGKILCCGNGGSACDCEHLVAELVNRFQQERANLPAIALTANMANLTAIANDYSFAEVFAKQINALGNAHDILVAISTSGNSANVLQAVAAAQAKKMRIVVLTGKTGGKLISTLLPNDLALQVPVDDTPRIQEMHILIIHLLCDLIDNELIINK